MASKTIDMPPEDVEMSSEDVETSSEDVEDSDSDRYLEGTPYGPRHLYRPFKQHVEVREIDLRALNNTDWDKYSEKPDETCTPLDEQSYLDLLTKRFNEWLEEIRKTGGRDDSVLEEMNCDSVKFVGSLLKGYEFVSKPRPLKGKRRASKKDGGKNNGTEKKETPQRTHDKLLYGHPHPMASPFTSVTVFVKHAYWLIGRYTDAYGDNDDYECKPCDTSYAAAAICDGWVKEE
ncbi:hypothetical protein KCU83_g8803, partial [Aureobasidium melanogenum]